MPELAGKGALEAVREIERICDEAKINCFPSLRAGELEDARVFTAANISDDRFSQALEKAKASGECHQVEFKQTLGLHIKRMDNDRSAKPADLFSDEIIHEVVKTVVSFLNADGGVLIIGMCDDGTPFGIENEFAFVGGSKNLDQWELRLHGSLETFIPDYRLVVGYIGFAVLDRYDCKLCIITVEPRSDRIVVCRKSNKDGEDEIVYRRSGNRTLKLQARDIEALVLDRVRAKASSA